MKRYLLTFFLILSFAAFAISQKFSLSSPSAAQSGVPSPTLPVPSPVANENIAPEKRLVTIVKKPTVIPASPVSKPVPASPAPVVTKPKGLYRDGTFKGDAISEYYGTIQVAAVIQDGKLVDVQFLQYPIDRQTSANINNQALPILKSEAIAAQSANIDAVSGASVTSPAFISSLSSALALAKN